MKIKFCSQCGHATAMKVPDGDTRLRAVCSTCGCIHYNNPRIVAGCIVTEEQSVLLCRRAIEPRKGFWTLPAGFMEVEETMVNAAIRETKEEACAQIDAPMLFAIYDLPHIHQVQVFYRAELIGGRYDVGEESLEVALFTESTIPWLDLAFPTVTRALKSFFYDRQQGGYKLHLEAFSPEHGWHSNC